MKNLLSIFLALCLSLTSFAQGVQKLEKILGLNSYTYYPEGYDKGGQWPLIVFFPGKDEAGTKAELLMVNGPARFIKAGFKPKALVMSIQQNYPYINEHTINGILDEIIKKYRVDTNSIHITGLSVGATGVQLVALTPRYAKKLSTIVPMSATEVSWMYDSIPKIINSGVKWLGFSGNSDTHTTKMKILFSRIQNLKPDMATFIEGKYDHCCWNAIYDPAYKIPNTTQNIYDWMLSNPRIPPIPIDSVAREFMIIPHAASRVKKAIVLDIDGKWTEYEPGSIKTGDVELYFDPKK